MGKLLDNVKETNRTASFASRLSCYVIAVAALLFMGVSIAVSNLSKELIKKEASKNAFNQLHSTNQEIKNVLISVSTAVDNLAAEVEREAKNGNREGMFDITRDIVRNNKYIYGSEIALSLYYYPDTKYFSPYSYLDKDTIITAQVGNDNYAYQYMDWYQIPRLLNKSYWTDPFYDEGAGNTIMCTYTKPLYDADSTFIGVLTSDIKLDWISGMINSVKPYENSYIFVIGKGGSYIIHEDENMIQSETIFTSIVQMQDTTLMSLGYDMIAGKTGEREFDNDGELSYVFYAPIPALDWSIALVCPHKEVYEGAIKMGWILLIVTIVALTILFFIDREVIRYLVKPISKFSASAKEIAKGNFNAPMPTMLFQDEIADLRDSMVYMQKSLSEYISELHSTTAAKERIESELNIARNIQMGMIPKIFPPFPERTDVDLYASLRPAKEVGGDLYDFFIHEGKLFFLVGDVSGKGVPASLFMAVTRSLFRSVAASLVDPKLIIESMNNAIAETNEENMFVTMYLGILDLATGNICYCNAGHNPPCLIDADGKVSFLDVHRNPPIGLFEGFVYDNQFFTIKPGQSIFLYTDGVTEAENVGKELYSDKRLLDCLTGSNNLSTKEIIFKVLDSVHNHAQTAPQSDDITVMAIKYNGENGMEDINNKTLVIKNNVAELDKLREFIEKIGEDCGISPALVMSLNLVLEEVVTNVIFYAYPKGQRQTLEVKFHKNGKELNFEVWDSGKFFDPTAKEDADITLSAEERQIGGLGIFLVKKIMDTVNYRREDGMNILTMTKVID